MMKRQKWNPRSCATLSPWAHLDTHFRLCGSHRDKTDHNHRSQVGPEEGRLRWHQLHLDAFLLFFLTGHHGVRAHWPHDGRNDLQPRRHTSVLQWPGGLELFDYLFHSIVALLNHLHLVWGQGHCLFIFPFFFFIWRLETFACNPRRHRTMASHSLLETHLTEFPLWLMGFSLCSSSDVHWQFY